MKHHRAINKFYFLSALFFFVAGNSFAEARLSILDVGYGSCILLQTPTQNFLFDTGPQEQLSKILNFLADNKVGWLTAIFISHDQPDHTGALIKIMRQIPTKIIFWPDNAVLPAELKKIVKENSIYNTQIQIIEHGLAMKPERDLMIRALPSTYPTEDPNDNAIVYGLKYKKQKILISSDIGPERQADLVKLEAPWLKDTRILIWPHHGDKLNPVFKNVFLKKPLCVVTVGENPFHLPSPSLAEESQAFCKGLYRTDSMSDITFLIDRKITMKSADSLR